MRKWWKIGVGLCVAGLLFGNQFDDMTNDLTGVLNDGSTSIARSLAKNAGYYTGSGNVTPANASGFLGLKVGVGGSVLVPAYLWPVLFSQDLSSLVGDLSSPNASAVKTLSGVVGLVPLMSDMVYAKIGLPVLPMDVGLRLGFLPTLSFGDSVNYVQVGFFHVGAEARYKLTGINLVFAKSQVEIRGSYDYNSGVIGASQKVSSPAYAGSTVIGTNELTISMDNRWSGSSVGLKVVGGLSVLMFDLYAGLGANVNFGDVNTTLKSKVAFIDTTGSLGNQSVDLKGSATAGYDLFDLRVLAGVHIVFADLAVEWNPLNNALAITVVPVSLSF